MKPTSMKKCITILAFATLFLVSGKALQAQFKIAYLYADSLFLAMPEKLTADSAVDQVAKLYQDRYEKKEKEYVANTKEAQEMVDKNGGKQPDTDPKFQFLVQDIEKLYKELQEIEKVAQSAVGAKRQELYEPIIKKAKAVIAEVAKEKGYVYVLDASIGTIWYSQPQDNILQAVKKKLGIK